jgi:hypothetical protein
VGLLKSHAKSAKDAKEFEGTHAKAAKDAKESERTNSEDFKDTKKLERTDAKSAKAAKDRKGFLIHTQHCGRSVKSLHYSFSPKKVR